MIVDSCVAVPAASSMWTVQRRWSCEDRSGLCVSLERQGRHAQFNAGTDGWGSRRPVDTWWKDRERECLYQAQFKQKNHNRRRHEQTSTSSAFAWNVRNRCSSVEARPAHCSTAAVQLSWSSCVGSSACGRRWIIDAVYSKSARPPVRILPVPYSTYNKLIMKPDHQALLKVKYCPRVATTLCTPCKKLMWS